MYLAEQVIQLAYDPGIKPNAGGLPGLAVLKQVMGSINLFGIVTVVGALAVSAGVWAWGKKGVLVGAGAALLLGAANGVVAFFSSLGTQVH